MLTAQLSSEAVHVQDSLFPFISQCDILSLPLTLVLLIFLSSLTPFAAQLFDVVIQDIDPKISITFWTTLNFVSSIKGRRELQLESVGQSVG